ncbi:MAG: hypothetical protein WCI93_03130 [bacterium]
MKTNEVFQLIHQNGIGQNIRCFFSSEDIKNKKDHMSLIHNYKYREGMIKVCLDKFHLKEHLKNLIEFPECELLLKENKGQQSTTVFLFCKFLKVENNFIYVRVFNIKYFDDEGKAVNQRVQVNDKTMESL